MIRYGSVCSGIEAASIAWGPLGWKAAWFAEVDRAASEVLAYRFPEVVNHGDMTALPAKVRRREIAAPDILVGGTPCQSFSVAGMRRGMSDPRGQLTLSYVDLADAIDEVRISEGEEECVIVWENVPGCLSSHDNAFGCFLAALVGDDEPLVPGSRPEPGRSSAHWTWDKKAGQHRPKWTDAGYVAGPKRAAAWRVQDAQYHGLAQRRRRVFVVASARQGFDPSTILLEFDGVRRDSAPSREAGEGAAGTLASRTTGGGFPGTDEACSGYIQPYEFRGDAGLAFGGGNCSGPIAAAAALNCNERYDFDSETFVLDPSPIAFTTKDYGGDASAKDSPTLRSMGHNDSHANGGGQVGVVYAIQERAVSENPNAGPGGKGYSDEGVAYTLEARHHVQAVCVTGSVTHTLRTEGFDASEDGTGRGQPIVAIDIRNAKLEPEGPTMALQAGGIGEGRGMCINAIPHTITTMAVRRLMPVECERLQGFPDGWTLVPNAKGKPAADGPRYKQLGNSMATNVMHWIGRRIKAALPGDNGGPPLEDFESMLL